MNAQELIITNGDSAAEILKAANIGDHWLPWRDVLHEGPVPLTDDLEGLSRIRTTYLAGKGWVDSNRSANVFKQRDDLLSDAGPFKDVTLWFEHDLYDQLQLIQILDIFARLPERKEGLHLILADDFLGHQTPKTIGRFLDRKQKVERQHFNTARDAWRAFRQSTPEAFASLLNRDLDGLPFLKPGVLRMLEELPAPSTGLSRTERQMISLMDGGVVQAGKLFRTAHEMEESQFMGDWSFFDRLLAMVHCREPLIAGLDPFSSNCYLDEATRKEFLTARLHLTDFGKAVLSGREDHARRNDIEFWWGGTEVSSTNLWRWDSNAQQLKAP